MRWAEKRRFLKQFGIKARESEKRQTRAWLPMNSEVDVAHHLAGPAAQQAPPRNGRLVLFSSSFYHEFAFGSGNFWLTKAQDIVWHDAEISLVHFVFNVMEVNFLSPWICLVLPQDSCDMFAFRSFCLMYGRACDLYTHVSVIAANEYAAARKWLQTFACFHSN